MPRTPPNVSDPGRIIAHRGASQTCAENTLGAFREATRQGVNWIEFDVCLLGDQTPIVHHDATLERCTSASGSVTAIGAGDLGPINAAVRLGPDGVFEPLPTLEMVLDLIEELGLFANLEMKPHDGPVGALAAVVAEALSRRAWAGGRIITSSFILPELEAYRALAPEAPLAVLYGAPPPGWLKALKALDAAALHLDFRHLTQSLLEDAISRGLDVRVYTINEPDVMAPFREHGLTSVITDHPPLFLERADWAAWAKT